MLNFRLKTFYSVARNCSFTKAAEELFITQPAVTKNIKELEKNIGAELFIRSRSGVSLTESGFLLLHYAEEMLSLESQLKYDLSILKQRFAGSIKLGASTTIGQYILPSALAQFNAQFSEISLALSTGNTLEIEREVINRTIDLGIVEGNSKKKELKYQAFMRDEIVVVVHTSQELAKLDSISLEELKNIPLVLREMGSGTLDVIIEHLGKKNIKMKDLNIQIHLGSTESIKTFLAHSNSISLISVNAISNELAKGYFKIIDIDNFEIVRNFNFIHTQGQQNGFVKKFIDFAIDFYA